MSSGSSERHYRLDWAAEIAEPSKRSKDDESGWGNYSEKGSYGDWNDYGASQSYDGDRKNGYEPRDHEKRRQHYDRRNNDVNNQEDPSQYSIHENKGYNSVENIKGLDDNRHKGQRPYLRKDGGYGEEAKSSKSTRPPLLEDPPFKRNNMYEFSMGVDDGRNSSGNTKDKPVIESWADASVTTDSGIDFASDSLGSNGSSKTFSVVPQPITIDRLEASCEKEKEIRRNMTTLKKGSAMDTSSTYKKSEQTSPYDSKLSKENKQSNNAKEKSSAWNSSNAPNNKRPAKNGDRTRPEESKDGLDSTSSDNSKSTKPTSYAAKISGQTTTSTIATTEPTSSLSASKKTGPAPPAGKRQSPLLETPTADKQTPVAINPSSSKDQKESESFSSAIGDGSENESGRGGGGRGRGRIGRGGDVSASRGAYGSGGKSGGRGAGGSAHVST